MNSKGKIEKWSLTDWSSGRYIDVTKINNECITVQYDRKSDEEADMEGNKKLNISERASGNLHEEGRQENYSPSASSWEPTDDSSSSEDCDTEIVQSKTEKYIQQYTKRGSGKKIPLPVHRPNAVLQERQIIENNKSLNDNRKRKYQEPVSFKKSLPDSTRKSIPPKDVSAETININNKEILKIKSSFEELFKMLNEMKPKSQRQSFTADIIMNEDTVNDSQRESKIDMANLSCQSERSDRSQSVESDRSDDNVLITNKFHKARIPQENQTKYENEWVPIGSGKTLIHKDKYRKVNWKSYTIATRKLLSATFPRRILATHSLTGKRSPAFLDKPAKMCLDPKIVSDIIIEITSKFNVKENLVRSIITTKCADECKMLKLRLKNNNDQSKKKKRKTQNSNVEKDSNVTE